MADTSQQEELPQTNGVVDGLTEEEKSKMRPADIDADMREMERRKRVEMMMNSRLFREELERIIETQMKDGAGPSGLLQQISEMMGHQGARFNANVFRNSNCVVPINDIRGVESMGYAKGEKLLRCKLASVFRLLDLYGWTQGVGGMITAQLNQDQEHFLVNPYGLLYHEVTASSLVKVDMQGNVVEQGTTNFGVHIAGYQLHSTIHAARPDIKCVVHIATPSVTAISSTKCGILPLGQESIVIGDVSNHQYINGGNLDPEEREKLSRNFGPINKVMLLTNRGAICCGETVEEAFFNVYNTVLACETQLKLMPVGIDNLALISDETRKAIYEASRKAPVPQQSSVAEPSPLAEKLEKRWRIGGTEFEALMRMLDNAGFRTGYIYRNPLVKSEPPRPRNDVEVPPAVSSLGYLLEEEELYKQGLWKGGRKGTDRTRWLNSPNVYQKVEILETGTPDPKKITKWVSDGSPTHSSTPVKIDGALQFVPKNTNPKEFKQLQQQIKDYRRADKISAGPQSHILEGVTWEEAKKMQDATISGVGEQVVLVGAASKGIIQRGFQHNAMVYKTPYAKNPFDAVTDQELDQYKKEVERKTRGDPYDESQSESEALSSFNISRATHDTSTAKSPIQSPVSVTSETEEESRDEPRVLRIATKQVPAPSQPEVVLSDGVSGVSRLSSSRSTSIEDWSWTIGLRPQEYEPCYLETARTKEIAQRMKPIITDVHEVANLKRKLKRLDFYQNYEKKLKSDDDDDDDGDASEDANGTKINDVQFHKNAGIVFATKVNLADDKTTDNNFGITDTASASPPTDEENANKNSQIQLFSNYDNNEQDTSRNNNLTVLSDNELANFYKQTSNFNENSDTSIDEIEYCVINHDKVNGELKYEADSNKFHQNENRKDEIFNQFEQKNDQETPIEPKLNSSSKFIVNKEITNFVNEVDFIARSTLFSSDDKIETTALMSTFETVKNKNTFNNANSELYFSQINDDLENRCNEKNSGFKHSTPSDVQEIGMNPFEDSLKSFLINERNVGNNSIDPVPENFDSTIYSSEESCEKSNITVKNLPLNFTVGCEPKSLDTNDNIISKIETNGSLNYLDVDQDSNFSRSLPNGFDSTLSEIDRDSECTSPTSTTGDCEFHDDDRTSKQLSRCDSVTEVVSSIKGDIEPSRVVLDFLANTENSVKYNLNSQKMNLMYSITPPIDDENDDYDGNDDDNNLSQNTSEPDNIFDKYENEEDEYENEKDEFVLHTSVDAGKKESTTVNKTVDFSETSLISNISNQGSDLLELPKHTFQDLQKSTEESFKKIMSTSVDQLMKELKEAEAIASAQSLVDEITSDVANLNLSRGNYQVSQLKLNNFVQDKISALNNAKQMAKDLINNLSCYESDSSTISKVSQICKENAQVESTDSDVYVIREIIYHVIDKDTLSNDDIKHKKPVTDKKAKESMNIELKGLKDDYDLEDEKSMKCSTPKALLTPTRSRSGSDCENQVDEPDSDNSNNENQEAVEISKTLDSKSPLSIETVESSNSSPSIESHNIAEQEITSESTDNDTKSDNSKEKQTDSGETFKIQSGSSPDQPNSIISLDSLDTSSANEKVEPQQLENNKLSYCLIEYTNQIDSQVDKNTDEIDQSINDDSLEESNVPDTGCNKEDTKSDVDKSLEEFIQNIDNRQETIDEMWECNEKQSENIIAKARLTEESDIKKEIMNDESIIHQLIEETESRNSYIMNYLEEQSATFIIHDDHHDVGAEEQSTSLTTNDENSDDDIEQQSTFLLNDDDPETTDSHIRYDQVDDCLKDESPTPLENIVNNQYLPPIKEESEFEVVENLEIDELSLHSIENKMNSSCSLSPTKQVDSNTKNCSDNEIEFCDDKLQLGTEKENNFNNELSFLDDNGQTLNSLFEVNSELDIYQDYISNSYSVFKNVSDFVNNEIESSECNVNDTVDFSKCNSKSESDLTVDNFEECSDSKTVEFYSCQNSISVPSGDEREKTFNSTLDITKEEVDESGKIYFADVSNIDDSSSHVYKSDSTESEEIDIDRKYSDTSENFADISSAGSSMIKNDTVTLQYMAVINRDTKEFVNFDHVTFQNNGDDLN